MAESFSRWESDPLFSAAEVVQDSADRMESVYRMLLHEEKLVQGCTSDTRLNTSIQYHRRDLVTALETTKWQLEDFEGAVGSAVSSDQSSSRENAFSKFRQFVKALREQIAQVEETIKAPSGVDFMSSPSMISNGHDTDGLALFLSRNDFKALHSNYDSESIVMKRFLDSKTDSNEIIELKSDEMESLPINGLHYSSQKDCEEVGTSSRLYDLELGDSTINCHAHKNRSRGYSWKLLRNFWISKKNHLSITKMRKDGELSDDLVAVADRKLPSTIFSISPPLKGIKSERFSIALHLYYWLDIIQRRLRHVIVFKQPRLRAVSALLLTLATLGIKGNRIADLCRKELITNYIVSVGGLLSTSAYLFKMPCGILHRLSIISPTHSSSELLRKARYEASLRYTISEVKSGQLKNYL